jgi:membrane peptidoglycan carboxypeptidase|tara:strand:- start:6 stop:107 length:102 start_codon:yes stop_codon:yes gene_type:complete
MEDIEQLYVLYQEGIITKKEYDDAKKALLNELK